MLAGERNREKPIPRDDSSSFWEKAGGCVGDLAAGGQLIGGSAEPAQVAGA
jgi:hypothetical protein